MGTTKRRYQTYRSINIHKDPFMPQMLRKEILKSRHLVQGNREFCLSDVVQILSKANLNLEASLLCS